MMAPYDGTISSIGCTCTCGNCCHRSIYNVVITTDPYVEARPLLPKPHNEDRFFEATNRVIREGRLIYPTPQFHLPSTPRWREYHTQR